MFSLLFHDDVLVAFSELFEATLCVPRNPPFCSTTDMNLEPYVSLISYAYLCLTFNHHDECFLSFFLEHHILYLSLSLSLSLSAIISPTDL